MTLENFYPVALEARAELLDKRAFTSMMQYSREEGCRAYCMLHSPMMPRWRTTWRYQWVQRLTRKTRKYINPRVGEYDSQTIILARNFGQTLSRYSNYVGNWTKSSYVVKLRNGKSVEQDYDCCSLTDVTLSAVSRSMWYSWLERVWLGATTMESPKGKKEIFGGNINNLRNQQSGICAKKPTGQVWR